MKSQPVELIMIAGDDVTPAEAAWYSTAKEVTEARLRRVPAMLEGLARGEWPDHLPHCYDAETEVFTNSGWKYWRDVTESDLLATVSPDGTFAYEKTKELIQSQYQGKMYGALSQHVDFLVTPQHRMWVSRRTNNGYKQNAILVADELLGKCYRLETGAVYVSGIGGTYQEGWFYGFFLGDGYRKDDESVSFHLKKRRKIDALHSCLDELGLPYKIYTNADGTVRVTVPLDDGIFTGKSKSKHIDESVYTMSTEYRSGVLQGLLDSDAHNKRGQNSFVFTSFSLDLAIGLDRLCATLGKYAKLKPGSDGYKVHILNRSVNPVVNPAQSKESTDFCTDYNGMVYCASVSTGLLLVRRNGRVMISGNSVPFEHTLISFRVTSEIATHIHMLKHRVGVSISSQSQRYMELRVDDYYMPADWPQDLQDYASGLIEQAFQNYHYIIKCLEAAGIDRKRAKESARFVLPYATQIRYRVTFNFLSFVHFQKLRNSEHAQKEIQLIAEEMLRLVKEDGHFANALLAWEL